MCSQEDLLSRLKAECFEAIFSNSRVNVAHLSDLYSLQYWQLHQTFFFPKILSCSIIKSLSRNEIFMALFLSRQPPNFQEFSLAMVFDTIMWILIRCNPVFTNYIVLPTGASDHASL